MPFESKFEFCLDKRTFQQYTLGQCLRSPTQVIGFFPCCLSLFPHGTNSTKFKGRYVSAFVEVLPLAEWIPGWEFADVQYEISLVDQRHPLKWLDRESDEEWESDSESKTVTKRDTVTFSRQRFDRGWHDLIPYNSLVADRHISETKGIIFRVSVKGDALGIQPKRSSVGADCPGDLPKRLYHDTCFTDMVVATSGGCECPCHRAVLGSASPVFERMLQSSFKEGKASRIVLTDVEEAELKALMDYIYKGSVTLVVDKAKMVELGDIYDLPTMAATYGGRMVEEMTADNVKRVMSVLRKSGQATALQELYKIAKKKVQDNPGMIDALVDDA